MAIISIAYFLPGFTRGSSGQTSPVSASSVVGVRTGKLAPTATSPQPSGIESPDSAMNSERRLNFLWTSVARMTVNPVVVHWDVTVDRWHVFLRATVAVADSSSRDPAVIGFADERSTGVSLTSVDATWLVARTDLRSVIDGQSRPRPASLRLEDVFA